MDFPSHLWQRTYNHKGSRESTVTSAMEEVILTHAKKLFEFPIKKSIFFLLGHTRVIGLKRNQLYTPTDHQLSPHHMAKISFSSSPRLGV